MRQTLKRKFPSYVTIFFILSFFIFFLLSTQVTFAQTKKWKIKIDGSTMVDNCMALAEDGTIYVNTNALAVGGSQPSRALYAITPAGQIKWQIRISSHESPVIGPNGNIYIKANPCSNDSVSYIYKITPQGLATQLFKLPHSYTITSTLNISKDGIIYFTEEGEIYAVDTDGNLKWNYKDPSGAHEFTGRVLIALNGNLYSKSMISPPGSHFLNIFTPTGKLSRTVELSGFNTEYCAIGIDGTIYYCDYHNLNAFNPETETKIWKNPDFKPYSRPVIGRDGTIFIGSHDPDYLYAVTPQGNTKWKYPMQGRVETPVVAKNNTVYASSWANELYSITADRGVLRWEIDTDEIVRMSPLLAQDGTLYFGYHPQNGVDYSCIHAIRTNSGGIATDTPWPYAFGTQTNRADLREYYTPECVTPINNKFISESQANSLYFTWKNIKGASLYTFEFSATPHFKSPTAFLQSTNTFVGNLSSLRKGCQYFWRVGTKSESPTIYSGVQSFIYGSPAVQCFIKSPSYDAIVYGKPFIAWEPFPGATCYELRINKKPDFSIPDELSGVTQNTSGTLPLKPGTYYLATRPGDANQNIIGEWSPIWKFTVK